MNEQVLSPMGQQKRQSKIQMEMGELGNMIEALHAEIKRLEDKLMPVLSPSVPQKAETKEEGLPTIPLAGEIKLQRGAVARALRHIREIKDRVEL